MNAAEIRKFDDQQLVHEELRLEREFIHHRFAHRTGQLDDTSRLPKLRKDIARLRTVQRERELAQGLVVNSLRERYRASFDPDGSAADPDAAEGQAKGFLKGIVDKVTGKE